MDIRINWHLVAIGYWQGLDLEVWWWIYRGLPIKNTYFLGIPDL